MTGSRSALLALADRCLFPGFAGRTPPPWVRRAAPGLGGVVLYGRNLRRDGDVARLAAELRADADVLVAVDEEGGDVTRLHYRGGATTPGNHVLGRLDDPGLTAAVAAAIGAELAAAGVGFDLAPDVDVNVDPLNPVIGVRSFGADPDLVARHGAAWVRGLQSRGVAACAKHFPGHGDTRVDSHHGLPVVGGDAARWRAAHLPPFAAAIAAGVRAVMTAHLVLPAVEPGVPATLSRRLLTDVLRGELGFAGVVITDALDMGAIRDGVGAPAAAVAALAAGADAICLGHEDAYRMYRTVRAAIADAAADGALPRARLAEAAERVAGLRGHPPGDPVPAASPADLRAAARRAVLARGVAPLRAAPVLVELRAGGNLAVGDVPWDLAGPLAELGLAPVRRLAYAGVVPPDDRPLVVLGRDVPRTRPADWAALRAARPDAILVDVGLPRPDALADPYVLVGGAARPNLRAAAEVLAGRIT
ncbi:hydrolase [Pilimelia anulata]|uniref:Hydrolase n=1 Tax=Pilimelia anulata TaxID=53371 RepID=A0A8J3BBJ8_9ACTN|nr:glycoside hydrolase family 3 N-terminal domain-containing protein [Pilimelia anulata]GGJ94623.1 hydrolase [Pilimelia anulata]